MSAVGLFCCDKFEETPKQKVIDRQSFKKITLDLEKRCSDKNALKCFNKTDFNEKYFNLRS